jgi:phosphatidyl-myo-inositol dimannoside synthase
LSDKGNKIHFWVPDLYSITGGIQIFCQHFIQAIMAKITSQNARVLVKNDAPEALSRQQLPYQITGYGDSTSLWRTARFGLDCLRFAQRERPKLLICMHLHFSPLAELICNIFNIPYVLVTYGIEAWHNNNKLQYQALQKASMVLTISNHTRDWLIESGGVKPERIRILAPTFTPHLFSITGKSTKFEQKLGLKPTSLVILTVCRLAQAERYKGYDQIIKALPAIIKEIPEIQYIIVGKGPDRERVLRLIDETGVQEHVILTGFVPDEELADYYNLCDVFAMPSKEEGFGIVYLEALSCGKPVLAGNKDGSRDALLNGELGVLVDPDNVGEIAGELIRILKRRHPHPLIYQPEMLRQRVIESFGFESFKQKVVQHLSDFI